MKKLLCSHEKNYCKDRKTKFFRTGFGEIVVSQPHLTFRKHFDDVEKHKVYAFRNRGIKEKQKFQEIISKSAVPPVVSDIEDDDWRGDFGVYWS